jgi:hypothetical protein
LSIAYFDVAGQEFDLKAYLAYNRFDFAFPTFYLSNHLFFLSLSWGVIDNEISNMSDRKSASGQILWGLRSAVDDSLKDKIEGVRKYGVTSRRKGANIG